MPDIADALIVRGAHATGAAHDLLIEVPHGADGADYDAWAHRMQSPLPHDLKAFFYANTDEGAFELAAEAARAFVERAPGRSVVVVRSRIPRTLVDCNRRIDAGAAEFRAGGVTPGFGPWVTSDADRIALSEGWTAYQARVDDALAGLAPDGAALLLHTFGPRTVDVEVDGDIVVNLRRAYEPEVEPTWPLRPAVEVIARDAEGIWHAPADVAAALSAGLAEVGVELADSVTYPMHPSTMAWSRVTSLPGRVLCVEVRRDLVCAPWMPFEASPSDPAGVARYGALLADAALAWWPQPGTASTEVR